MLATVARMQAIDDFRAALARDAAMPQASINLAEATERHAQHLELAAMGEESLRWLEKAVGCYRQALTVCGERGTLRSRTLAKLEKAETRLAAQRGR